MKKLISTGLVIFVMLTLSVSVLSAPDNIFDGTYVIDEIEFNNTSSLVQFSFEPITLDFGSNYKFNVDFRGYDSSLGYYAPFLNGEFTITLDFPSTVFIACSSNYVITQPVFWDDYRDPDRDFSITYSNSSIPVYDIEFNFYDYDVGRDFISIDDSTSSFSGSITYNCFDDIPAGTYTIGYGFTTAALPIADMPGIICGIYISSFSINDPVGSYDSGLIDFETAIGAIYDNMQEILDNPNSTVDEKILAVNLADFELDRISYISDIKYNTVVNNFTDSASTIVNNYFTSGSTDPQESIEALETYYVDALTQSNTAEQGTFLNTAYMVYLSELSMAWEYNYKVELDNVITDEDLSDKDVAHSQLNDYLNSEEEIYILFDDAEYSSYLQFESFLRNLKGSDITVLRRVYEHFLTKDTGSVYYNFVTIPFVLVVFALVLSTSLVVFSDRGGSRG